MQTRSRTAKQSQSPTFEHNEGASSSKASVRESNDEPQHTYFDTDSSDSDDQPTRSTQRLNIGGSSRPGEEWHTVTKKRRRRQSVQNVKIPSVQLHAATGPHTKNIHILRAAAVMPGRKGNILDETGKPISSKGLQSTDFGTSRCTVCILVRSKRQPIRRTDRLDRSTNTGHLDRNANSTNTSVDAGAFHLSAQCTH